MMTAEAGSASATNSGGGAETAPAAADRFGDGIEVGHVAVGHRFTGQGFDRVALDPVPARKRPTTRPS